MWLQRQITSTEKSCGFHLITDEVLSSFLELKKIKTGLTHFFLQHLSASLSLNENADASVRRDFESHSHVLVPESASYYEHIYKGVGDIPAHIKSSFLGSPLSVPIHNGKLVLVAWQESVLREHRDAAGPRDAVAA